MLGTHFLPLNAVTSSLSHTHYLSLIPSKTSWLQPVFDCLVLTLGYTIVFVGV